MEIYLKLSSFWTSFAILVKSFREGVHIRITSQNVTSAFFSQPFAPTLEESNVEQTKFIRKAKPYNDFRYTKNVRSLDFKRHYMVPLPFSSGWKNETRDDNRVYATILTHISKLHAFGFGFKSLRVMHGYLNDMIQRWI